MVESATQPVRPTFNEQLFTLRNKVLTEGSWIPTTLPVSRATGLNAIYAMPESPQSPSGSTTQEYYFLEEGAVYRQTNTHAYADGRFVGTERSERTLAGVLGQIVEKPIEGQRELQYELHFQEMVPRKITAGQQ